MGGSRDDQTTISSSNEHLNGSVSFWHSSVAVQGPKASGPGHGSVDWIAGPADGRASQASSSYEKAVFKCPCSYHPIQAHRQLKQEQRLVVNRLSVRVTWHTSWAYCGHLTQNIIYHSSCSARTCMVFHSHVTRWDVETLFLTAILDVATSIPTSTDSFPPA